MTRREIAFLVGIAVAATAAEAKPYQELFPGKTYQSPDAQHFVESIDYKQGAIELSETGVELRVPKDFYFLSAPDARRVIVDVWRNPPASAEKVLGMIFPITYTPADDTWGAIITYDADGYISDEEAEKIDYSQLLKTMQEATLQSNEARLKEGYPKLTLVGWASPPFYDRATNKLHWAKELQFGDEQKHTLNYYVRALGRRGVLNINFVSGMDQLSEIRSVVPAVLAMPEFVTPAALYTEESVVTLTSHDEYPAATPCHPFHISSLEKSLGVSPFMTPVMSRYRTFFEPGRLCSLNRSVPG